MIYVVRHGQTEFNVARRYQGQLDSPLTARGELQAQRMGERLAGLIGEPEGWRIVASPLGRAVRSAEIIRRAIRGAAPLELDPRLAEISMGAWDGLTYEALEARRPPRLHHAERYFHGPGGESYEDFVGRLRAWLDELAPDPRVIAVTHGVASRILRGLYVDMPRLKMLRLDVPQDALFRLAAGRLQRFDCDPVS